MDSAHDAPPLAVLTSPEEVYDALEAQHGPPPPNERNQRQHERMPWLTELVIWVRERKWESPRELFVHTNDISRGGFSFLHSQFLYPERMIYTCFNALPGQPMVAGVVTNCAYVGSGRHRVGVRFLCSKTCDELSSNTS